MTTKKCKPCPADVEQWRQLERIFGVTDLSNYSHTSPPKTYAETNRRRKK